MMSGCWKLALLYVRFYWARTAMLVAAVTICLCLPLATRWIVQDFEREASSRATATPIVLGAKGSQFGLVLHALYFRGDVEETIPQSELDKLKEREGVRAMPIHARFKSQGVTIVGSDDNYLGLRKFTLASGEPLERLGDCLLGASVARQLGLSAGEYLISDPDNLFDLAGPAPLRMRIRGVLNRTGTADDDVIHCHVKTCWLIAGLGHSHAINSDSSGANPDGAPGDHSHQASRENLSQNMEVTAENARSFHFHGTGSQFPLTAIIAVPETEKAETLLLGSYLDPQTKYQAVRPIEVVAEILRMVAQVRQLIDLLAVVLSLATGLLVVLVLWLSLKLRQRELNTLQLLGVSRSRIATIICMEMGLVCASSVCLALLLASGIAYSSTWLVYWFLV